LLLAAAMFALPGNCPVAKASAPADLPAASVYQSRATHRQTIRRMPLMHRPNRPGHFLGNTLRGRRR
jgi:hypothetical protein